MRTHFYFALLPLLVGGLPLAQADQVAPIPLADTENSSTLREFLIDVEGAYGWQPVEGTISFDFFPDGRLHVQGPDGEATMWEGKWSLKGDQLTTSYVDNDGKKQVMTVTAVIDGEELHLDGKVYRRYRP